MTLLLALLLSAGFGAFVVLGVAYAVRTPIWQNPDEPAHFNYVAFVAQTGGLPVLDQGDWDSDLLELVKNGQLEHVDQIRYEDWQPPLFYLLAAPLLRAGPLADVYAAVLRLRLLDVAFGALTLGVGWLAAREVFSKDDVLLAGATPLVMAGVPMLTAVSGSISADPLANLLAAVVVWLLLVWLRPSTIGSAGWAVGVGAVIGLGVLAKVAVAIVVPLALVVLARKSQRWVRDAALLLGTCGLVVLPWLVHQVTSYGWLDPLAMQRHAQVVTDQPRFPGFGLEYVVDMSLTTFHSFWAQFGWMAIVAPAKLYWAYAAVMLLALVGLVRGGWRWLRAPPWQVVVAAVVLAVVAYMAYNLSFKQFQGRYLFTAIVPICLLLMQGWRWLAPRRFETWGVVGMGAALVVLNAYALVRVMLPGFAPPGAG